MPQFIINGLILITKILLTLPLLIAIIGGFIKETQDYNKIKLFFISIVATIYIIILILIWE